MRTATHKRLKKTAYNGFTIIHLNLGLGFLVMDGKTATKARTLLGAKRLIATKLPKAHPANDELNKLQSVIASFRRRQDAGRHAARYQHR